MRGFLNYVRRYQLSMLTCKLYLHAPILQPAMASALAYRIRIPYAGSMRTLKAAVTDVTTTTAVADVE